MVVVIRIGPCPQAARPRLRAASVPVGQGTEGLGGPGEMGTGMMLAIRQRERAIVVLGAGWLGVHIGPDGGESRQRDLGTLDLRFEKLPAAPGRQLCAEEQTQQQAVARWRGVMRLGQPLAQQDCARRGDLEAAAGGASGRTAGRCGKAGALAPGSSHLPTGNR